MQFSNDAEWIGEEIERVWQRETKSGRVDIDSSLPDVSTGLRRLTEMAIKERDNQAVRRLLSISSDLLLTYYFE